MSSKKAVEMLTVQSIKANAGHWPAVRPVHCALTQWCQRGAASVSSCPRTPRRRARRPQTAQPAPASHTSPTASPNSSVPAPTMRCTPASPTMTSAARNRRPMSSISTGSVEQRRRQARALPQCPSAARGAARETRRRNRPSPASSDCHHRARNNAHMASNIVSTATQPQSVRASVSTRPSFSRSIGRPCCFISLRQVAHERRPELFRVAERNMQPDQHQRAHQRGDLQAHRQRLRAREQHGQQQRRPEHPAPSR